MPKITSREQQTDKIPRQCTYSCPGVPRPGEGVSKRASQNEAKDERAKFKAQLRGRVDEDLERRASSADRSWLEAPAFMAT